MTRKLLATTAALAMLTGVAVAQQQPAPADPAPATTTAPAVLPPATPIEMDKGQLASNIIGEAIYDGPASDAQHIGTVDDFVLDGQGNIKSLVVGVGGFLGMGKKSVELDYKTAQWVEKDGDRWMVVPMTKDQLLAAADFDRAPFDPVAPMPTAAVPEQPATTEQPAPPPAATDVPRTDTTTPTEPRP